MKIQIQTRYRELVKPFGCDMLVTEANRLLLNGRNEKQAIDQLREAVITKALLKKHGKVIHDNQLVADCEDAVAAFVREAKRNLDIEGVSNRPVSYDVPPCVLSKDANRMAVSRSAHVKPPRLIVESMNKQASVPYRVNAKTLNVLCGIADNIKSDIIPLTIDACREIGDKPFYLPVFDDWRFRTYADDRGVLPSYQGDHIRRGLIEFANPKPMRDLTLANEIIDDEFDRTPTSGGVSEYIISNKTKGHCLKSVAARSLNDHYILMMDATQSGLQHIACMMRDWTLLEDIIKNDVYLKTIENCNHVKINTLDKKTARKLLGKPTVIQTVYGSTPEALAMALLGVECAWDKEITFKELVKTLEEDPILASQVSVDPAPAIDWWLEDSILVRLERFRSMARSLQDALFRAYPSLRQFLTVTKGAAQAYYNRTGEIISWNHPLSNTTRVQPFPYKRGNSIRQLSVNSSQGRFKLNMCQLEADTQGRAAAVPPCLVHTMDAAVVHSMTHRFMDEDICFVHDCVGCHISDAQSMIDAWTDVMVNLYKDRDWLGEFLRSASRPVPLRPNFDESQFYGEDGRPYRLIAGTDKYKESLR